MRYALGVKSHSLKEREVLMGETLSYMKKISYDQISPSDVPIKTYWLNWSTTI